MEGTGTHEFVLTGADEKPHSYLVVEHPAGEGMEIMYELLGLGAPAVVGIIEAGLKSAELARAALKALLGDDDTAPSTAGALLSAIAEADLDDLIEKLREIDLSGVGAELGRALGTGKAPKLTKRIVAHAHRDGKSLGKDFDFGVAFQANYGELLQLVWKVCTINRFFPASFSSPSSPSAKKSPTN